MLHLSFWNSRSKKGTPMLPLHTPDLSTVQRSIVVSVLGLHSKVM